MEGQHQRGRSPSGNQQGVFKNEPSPHFPGQHDNTSVPTNLTLGSNFDQSGFDADSFNPNQTFQSSTADPALYNTSGSFNGFNSVQFNQQDQGFGQNFKQEQQPQQNQRSPSPFEHAQNTNQQQFLATSQPGDFTLYQGQDQNLDPNLFMDPSLDSNLSNINQSINPADLMSSMASPHSQSQSPPHLLQAGSHPASPNPQFAQLNQPHRSPHHSHSNSLDPASAFFPPGTQSAEWQAMSGPQFQGHRRAPSEHSDVSSNHPSPYLQQQESFDSVEQHHSPLFVAQDQGFQEQVPNLEMEGFTLSDNSHQRGISPGHSPRISIDQGIHNVQSQGSPYMMPQDMGAINQFGGGPGPELYTNQQEAFPGNNQMGGDDDMGQAANMQPPEINIEFAGPTKVNSFGPGRGDADALSPPPRSGKSCFP
jgi:transcription factor CRZ1